MQFWGFPLCLPSSSQCISKQLCWHRNYSEGGGRANEIYLGNFLNVTGTSRAKKIIIHSIAFIPHRKSLWMSNELERPGKLFHKDKMTLQRCCSRERTVLPHVHTSPSRNFLLILILTLIYHRNFSQDLVHPVCSKLHLQLADSSYFIEALHSWGTSTF